MMTAVQSANAANQSSVSFCNIPLHILNRALDGPPSGVQVKTQRLLMFSKQDVLKGANLLVEDLKIGDEVVLFSYSLATAAQRHRVLLGILLTKALAREHFVHPRSIGPSRHVSSPTSNI